MNIAILIGVSEYQNANPLQACKNDVNFIANILKATGKYDNNILCISEKTNASNIKEKITDKIEEFKDKPVEEIFFYYTGHGLYDNDEFYYILSDYDEDKLKQTSLENSELDNWLRSLNPEMTIKVVDACNSGMMYVKGTDKDIEKSLMDSFWKFNKPNDLKSANGAFNKCYFMFSSKLDESSYIYKESKFSLFTESFIDAFKFHDSKDIRYKDIIDYISDRFSKIAKKQTPLFIIQAHNTEKFCSMNPIKKLFSPSKVIKIEPGKVKEEKKPEKDIKNLVSIIEKDAESYLEKEEVFELLGKIEQLIQKHQYSDEFTKLYEINHLFMDYGDYDNIPKLDVVGQWLANNDNEYFAEVKSELQEIKEPMLEEHLYNNLYSGIIATNNLLNALSPPKYERVIIGYKPTVNCPYDIIKFEANPKLPNIPLSECIIAFVISQTEIRFFFSYVNYKKVDWDNYEIGEKGVQWEIKVLKYKDNIFDFMSNIQNNFADFVINELKEKYEN